MCPTITVGSFFYTRKVHFLNTSTTSKTHLSPTFFQHFFEVFWIAPEGPPFICFDILQHNGCQKIAKGPSFYIFWQNKTFFVQKSHFHFFWEFFSSPQRAPPQFFSNFLQPAGVSQSPKGPPFKF